MPKVKKVVQPPVLRIPSQNPNIDNWIVLGLDPSVSRTGFAILGVYPERSDADSTKTELRHEWLSIGSAKPDKIEDESRHSRTTLWLRSKAIALFLREFLKLVPVKRPADGKSRTGLIISMEYPTPMNDFLVALNRIIHVIFFEDGTLADMFGEIRILTTNASTLRSLMGLKQRGASNKKENILKAYTFVDQKLYPELDSDACDAVLMAMMGLYTAAIQLGQSNFMPDRFLTSLCNATEEIKGKGRNARTVIKGILHRNEYWYTYERQSYGVGVKDASNPKKTLTRKYFSI